MMSELFLRQIPTALEAGIRSGEFAVYGSTIRHIANGQIAGFLQETGGMGKIVAEVAAAGPLAPVKVAEGVIRIVQNEQIKAGLAAVQTGIATINQLQLANLALGAAGIGIMAAGFAALNAKIDRVHAEVRALDGKMDTLLEAFARDRSERFEDMIEALRDLGRRIDARWGMSIATAEAGWHRDADEADRLGSFFTGRARRLLDARPHAVAEATPLLDAGAMASGLRVGAMALTGETTAAIGVARDEAARLERLTGTIGAADLARAWLAAPVWQSAPGSMEAGHALTRVSADATRLANSLRTREASAHTRAAPLSAMQAKRVHPRAWIEVARSESVVPMLFMLV